MTWHPGASFIVQRCNQCRAPLAAYYKGTDEYLCEACEDFARTMVAVKEKLNET